MWRRYLRASALAGLTGLIISASIGAGTAVAHPGEGNETDADHAKEDLAGTSIVQIEKDTAAKAAKIKKATGDTPGRLSKDQNVANAKVSAAAAQDPGQGGHGARCSQTSVVPIFQAVLPNGKVLMWDSVGQTRRSRCPNNTFTRAMVWDPTTNTRAQGRHRLQHLLRRIHPAGRWPRAGRRREQECCARRDRADSPLRLADRDLEPRAGYGRCPLVSRGRRLSAMTRRSSLAAVRRSRRSTRPTDASPIDQRQRLQRSVLRIPDHPAEWAGRVDGSANQMNTINTSGTGAITPPQHGTASIAPTAASPPTTSARCWSPAAETSPRVASPTSRPRRPRSWTSTAGAPRVDPGIHVGRTPPAQPHHPG